MELQRPEESTAPYPYRKLKETHELIFSWLIMASGIAHGHDDDDNCGGVAQDGSHPPNNRLTETGSLGLPYHGLKFIGCRGHVFY